MPPALFAHAQTTGTISGKVTDTSNKPLNAVNVSLKDSGKGAATNANGNFRIENVAPGSYTLRITAVGYVEQELAVKVASGQTLSVPIIILKIKSQRLDGVEVTGEGSLVPTKETEYVARMPLANIENPQVYNVVTSKLLEKQGVVDYKTTLNNIAGVGMAGQSGNSRGDLTQIRGFRVSSNVRNGVSVSQITGIDIANIERVEVIKDPTGTLFGGAQNSYGGVVNRITKKPFENFVTNVTHTTGSWGFNRLTADVNTPLKKNHTVLLRNNIALETTNSWQDAGYHNSIFYAPSLVYKASDRLTLSLDMDVYGFEGTPANLIWAEAPGAKRFKDLDFDRKISFNSNQLYNHSFGVNAYARVAYKLTKDWTSTTLVNYGRSDVQSMYPITFITSRNSANIWLAKFDSNYTVQQVQQNINGSFQLAGLTHRVLIGLDYFSQNNFRVLDLGIGTGPRGFFVTNLPFREKRFSLTRESAMAFFAKGKPRTTQSNIQTYSTYFSDVIDFTEQFHLLLSLRMDRFDNEGTLNMDTGKTTGGYQQTALAPRLGLVYELLPKQLSLFASYNNGFVNKFGTDIKGNAFKPEKANQMEGGLKWEPKSKVANLTLSYYHINVEDMVRPDAGNRGFNIQDGNVKSSGFELDMALYPLEGLNLIMGYAYNDSEIVKGRRPEENGNRLRGTPRHLANFFASYTFSGALKGLDVGFGGNYGSDIFVRDNNKFILDAYTILNANVGYSVGKVRFGIRAENLTSAEQFVWHGTQAYAPLRVLGSVSMRF